jgi:hypothetical protein
MVFCLLKKLKKILFNISLTNFLSNGYMPISIFDRPEYDLKLLRGGGTYHVEHFVPCYIKYAAQCLYFSVYNAHKPPKWMYDFTSGKYQSNQPVETGK